MKVYNVVFMDLDKKALFGAYVSVYSYSSLHSAIDEAVGMIKDLYVDSNRRLYNGRELVSLAGVREALEKYHYYANICESDNFWIRIDKTAVEG